MTHRRLGLTRLGLATVLALGVPLACGGNNSADLFGSGGSAGANGDASAGTGGTGTGGMGTGGTSTGGTGTGGTGTGGTGTGGTGTGGTGTGGTGTGGTGTGGTGTGGTGTGGTGTGGTGTGGTGTGGTSTGGTSTGGTGTGGTGTGGTGTGGTGTGGTGTGGTGTGGTGGAGTGGAGGSGGITIDCGNSTCSGPSQVCCVTRGGITSQPQYSCIDSTSQCACSGMYCTATTVSCDGPADCPSGQVCCGTFVNGGYTDLTCSSNCNGIEMCQPNDGIPCQNGGNCNQSNALPGYYFCGP